MGFLGNIAPEIVAHQFLVRKPDGTVMVVICGTGMSHSSQSRTAWTNQWIKKRPRIFSVKMPTSYFFAGILNRNLIVSKRDNLAFWDIHFELLIEIGFQLGSARTFVKSLNNLKRILRIENAKRKLN